MTEPMYDVSIGGERAKIGEALSLRAYATAALQGLLANPRLQMGSCLLAATMAFEYADEMLREERRRLSGGSGGEGSPERKDPPTVG